MHFIEAKSILSPQNGMNIYRGCTHGCIYCDSRSVCYGMKHRFDDIEVKINAPELLEKALISKRRLCMISTGAMCDPYLHAEERLRLTRSCLEIIERRGFGVAVQTKSTRVLRDIDLLESINAQAKSIVQFTLTTADDSLCRILEPNVSVTSERVNALKQFSGRGIPVIVWLTPTLPFINDSEENLRRLLDMCLECGVKGIITFGFGLTLREGDREYYYAALDRHFPGLKEKYISVYGNAYELPVPDEKRLIAVFSEFCARHGIMSTPDECFRFMREFPERQLSMF